MRKAQQRPEGLLSRIQHLADLAGSVAALAERSGQSRRTLTDWLREVREPTPRGLRRLVDALGINQAWLLGGHGPAPRTLSGGALKGMDFQELVIMQTGESIMALGQGSTMKSIIREAMRVALQWKAERAPDGK